MKTKKILIVFFSLLSIFGYAQSSDRWQLSLNNKRIATGSLEKVGEAIVNSKGKGTLIIRISGTAKNDNKRTILIFDTNRQQLISVPSENRYGKFRFKMEEIKSKTNGQPFQIYSSVIPKDPRKAAVVRMSPQLICTVNWKAGK